MSMLKTKIEEINWTEWEEKQQQQKENQTSAQCVLFSLRFFLVYFQPFSLYVSFSSLYLVDLVYVWVWAFGRRRA